MGSESGYIKISSPDQLAKEFKKSRNRQDLTMEKIADFAGLSRYAIMNFENQKKDIKLTTLMKLLDLCNIEVYIKANR